LNKKITLLNSQDLYFGMRGRWLSFAAGSAIARNRTQAAMNAQMQAQQQQAAVDAQMQAQQAEIERLKAQSQPARTHQQDDPMLKLQKLTELHKQGALTDEEFSKLKMDLLSKM
jgi:hypothetical protein